MNHSPVTLTICLVANGPIDGELTMHQVDLASHLKTSFPKLASEPFQFVGEAGCRQRVLSQLMDSPDLVQVAQKKIPALVQPLAGEFGLKSRLGGGEIEV